MFNFDIGMNQVIHDGIMIFLYTVAFPYILGKILTLLWNRRYYIQVFFKKIRLYLLPVNFNIAFAIDSAQGINTGFYYGEIKKKIEVLIESNHLTKSIKVIDFSDIKKFNSYEQAKKFRESKEIDLLIWGEFSNDRLKQDGESLTRANLNFTYGHPETREKKIGPMLRADISSRLALKNYWSVTERSSYDDVSIVADNIFQISIYILALTLKLYGSIEKSLELFENLYTSLTGKDQHFQDLVVPHIVNCSQLLSIENYYSRKDYSESSRYLEKILAIIPNDKFALSGLAVCRYKLGQIEQSKDLVDRLLQFHPQVPSTELNVAFIRILEKKYKDSLLHYKRLMNFDSVDFNPQEAVEFLGIEYDKHKDAAMLFGSAVISMKFGDRLIAVKDFKRFLKKSNENLTSKSMYRCAKRLLKQTERKLKESS